MLLVVNYHYVRACSLMSEGVRGVDVTSLRSQVELIGRSFEFVTPEDLRRAVEEGRSLSRRSCLITFDDGLREQFENAWPVLSEQGVTGLFFVSPEFTLSGRVATVHRVHMLRGAVGTDALVDAAIEEMRESVGTDFSSLEDIVVPPEQYKYDSDSVRRKKYFLNFVVPADVLDRVSEALFERQIGAQAAMAADLYMDQKMWRELAGAGALGSHGMTHTPLAQLPTRALERELCHSKRLLEEQVARDVHAVSYPYGGATAVGPTVEKAASAAGYRLGFTMERAVNTTLDRPLMFARLDANDAPGGTHAVVEIVGDRATASAPVTVGRKAWHTE